MRPVVVVPRAGERREVRDVDLGVDACDADRGLVQPLREGGVTLERAPRERGEGERAARGRTEARLGRGARAGRGGREERGRAGGVGAREGPQGGRRGGVRVIRVEVEAGLCVRVAAAQIRSVVGEIEGLDRDVGGLALPGEAVGNVGVVLGFR